MDTLRISTFGRSGPHQAALSNGYYVSENLQVDLDVTQASKAQMQQLKDGTWDLVHTNADNVFWWNEDNGADFLIVLALPGKPNQSFVVRPEIATYEDLRGKAIAVDAALSGYVTPLRVLLRQAGLAEEGPDYHFIEVGATQQRIDAMKDGRAYGAMVGVGQDTPLVADGFRILDSINRLYTNYAGSAAARRDWIQAKPDLLQRYLRAHLKGVQAGGRTEPLPAFGWDGLRAMMETRHEVGLLRGTVDPHRFADDSLYLRALDTLG